MKSWKVFNTCWYFTRRKIWHRSQTFAIAIKKWRFQSSTLHNAIRIYSFFYLQSILFLYVQSSKCFVAGGKSAIYLWLKPTLSHWHQHPDSSLSFFGNKLYDGSDILVISRFKDFSGSIAFLSNNLLCYCVGVWRIYRELPRHVA